VDSLSRTLYCVYCRKYTQVCGLNYFAVVVGSHFRTVVCNIYECVNSFKHLDYGLVNFAELWTHFGVPCTVCTLEIHTGLWAQLLCCSCGLTFLELL